MKIGDFKDATLIGAVLAGGIVAYRLLSGARSALTTAGEALGSGLFDLFHPNQIGETLFFTARFPDGKLHSVPSRSVDANGLFVNTGDGLIYKGDGKRYRLLIDKRITSGVNMSALPV